MNPPYPSDEFWLLTGLALSIVIIWIGVGLTMALYLWIDRKRKPLKRFHAAQYNVNGMTAIIMCETVEELSCFCFANFQKFDGRDCARLDVRLAGDGEDIK